MVDTIISDIDWGESPALRDPVQWEKALSTVKMLCGLGEVTRWLRRDRHETDYPNMPYHFDIKGVRVEFLPHWGFYSVCGISLNIPDSEDDVLEAVSAVQVLKRFGYDQE